jgi:PAS domain S-box-containing protein
MYMKRTSKEPAATKAEKIAALVRTLRETEAELQSLTGEQLGRRAGEAETVDLISELRQEGIHGLDADGRIVFANRAASAMFGWREEEMRGKAAHELIHHHSADGREYPVAECPIYQTLRDGQRRRIEHEFFCRQDGTFFSVEYVCSPVRDEAGAIAGVVVCFQDVSERKRTEEALRAQATLLENAQRIGRMGSWALDERSGRLTWSEATCALFGITRAEFRGTFEHFHSFLLPEDLPACAAVHAAITPAKPLLEAEYRIRRPDGSVRWMYERGTVEFDTAGRAIRRMGMVTDVTEERMSREQLERGTRLLSIAGRAARLGGWAIELPEHKLIWSDETCILHDLPPGYQPSFEEGVSYFPAEHRIEVMRYVEACARDGTPYDFEVPKNTARGRRIWVRCIGEAVRDASGKIIRLQGAFQDVTDRKQAELALFKSNRALRMLSACGVALTHIRNEKELLNEVCRVAVEIGNYRMAWVGYALDDAGRTIQPMAYAGAEQGYLAIARINWSEDNPAGRGPAGLAIRTGRLRCCADVEVDDGMVHWRKEALERGYRSIICLPLRDDHRTFGILGLYSGDIFESEAEELKLFTELADDLSFGINSIRSRAERRIAQHKIAEQAELLEKATDAIFVRDLGHRIVFWNKSAERVYGWKAEEVIGRPTTDFLCPDLKEYAVAIQVLHQKGEWGGELRKRARAGHALTLDCRWTLVRDKNDAPHSVLCIESDVTERKKLEEQIFRAQRMESIGILAGGIAHDLNNLLAPIMISIRLLRRDAKDSESQKIINTLEACSQRGAALVRQVLSFARGLEGQRIRVDLKNLLAELQLVMKEIFPRNIGLEFVLEEGVRAVSGDPTQLHQIFLNLCVNARDAMPNGGRLDINMENVVVDENYAADNPDSKTGEYVMVMVSDTGTGIAPGILDKIFEPFFTTKEHGKGTGLGLSTVLGIVKSHGGFIKVHSEPGQGTKFKVYLPARPVEQSPEIARLKPPGLRHGKGELILLVDDEPGIRVIAGRTLERFGYRVQLAGNGAEAAAIYAQHGHEISLVITDVSMPVMDGASLVLALKSINPQVRILVSSGLTTSHFIAEAREAGIHGFLPKPYTAEALLKALQQELAGPG